MPTNDYSEFGGVENYCAYLYAKAIHCLELGVEIWRDYLGYEGRFQVSNFGRFKSLARMRKSRGGCLCPVKEKILSPRISGRGYEDVYLKKDGIGRPVSVHRAVLETFFGPCPAGMQACHNDGNPRNNKLSNLRWDTSKNNNADRIKHGTDPVGERNPRAKVTDDNVRQIRKLYATGMYTQQQIADRYGIHQTMISCIVHRTTWKHIT